MDFDFLHQVRDYADTLDGIEPDRYAFSSRPSDYGSDGRYMLTIYPKANKAGSAAKGEILNRFFDLNGVRNGIDPDEEKELILEQIIKAKERAQGVKIEDQETQKELSCPKMSSNLDENVIENPENVTEDLESVNDEAETEGQADPSCDWEGASGSEPEDQDEEDTEPKIPSGERVSLHDPAFGELIDVCDGRINQALRMAVEAKQGFAFTDKITFDPRGGAFGIKYETGYQFDPIKVKSKGELCEEIEIILDDAGYPIIPYDREHQLTFEDTLEHDSGVTVTADKSGVVQSVELDDETLAEDKESPVENDDSTAPREDGTDPCECPGCSFYDLRSSHRCCFSPDKPYYGAADGYPADEDDIAEAVEEYECLLPAIQEVYNELFS